MTFAPPTGYVASPAGQGSDETKNSDPINGTYIATVVAGVSNNHIDAGFYLSRALGNQVFNDFNNNGIFDAGETGISGVTVYLYADYDMNNVSDYGAFPLMVTTTNASGVYQFSGLATTGFMVGVVLPTGYTRGVTTTSSADPNNGTDNDNNGVTLSSNIVLSNHILLSSFNNTLDFGLRGTGSIGDRVFNDTNGNGIQDAGETGISGATVSLTNSSGMTINTTSNSSGVYSFTNVVPGTYTVTFTTPSGFVASPALQGGNTATDSDPSGGIVSVTVAAGEAITSVDAGFYQPYSLGILFGTTLIIMD
jgi:hypothetical protein